MPAKRVAASRGALVIVHDTGALISGLPLRLPSYGTTNYTTPCVVDEIIDRESRELLERMLGLGVLEVRRPSPYSLAEARRVAARAGVERRLSKTDLGVLALAIELSREENTVRIATDDYSLQRAATLAGLEYVRVRYPGIGARRRGEGRARRQRGEPPPE